MISLTCGFSFINMHASHIIAIELLNHDFPTVNAKAKQTSDHMEQPKG
jgi:hypothetical protein